MKKFVYVLLAVAGLATTGCVDDKESAQSLETTFTETIGNPTVEETLSLNAQADIFLWNDIVYETNIDWVDELTLTPGDLVGEITANATDASKFKNGTANALAVGTELLVANERSDVLIAKVDGTLKYYYMLVEG